MLVDTKEYKGYKINIHLDEYPDCNPMDDDNLFNVVCWHRRYTLGNVQDFSTPEDFHEWIKENPAIMLPVYMYDHSNICLNTNNWQYPFNDSWDAGQVGYIYITREQVRKEFSKKRISQKLVNSLLVQMHNFIQCYSDYLSGEVYGYQVEDEQGNDIDSCWGFIGDIEKSGLMEYARNAIDCVYAQKMDNQSILLLQPNFD